MQCFPPIQATIDIADVSLCLLIEIVTTEIRRPFPSSAATGRHKAGPTGYDSLVLLFAAKSQLSSCGATSFTL